MQDEAIPPLPGWSEPELDQAFAAIAREVEASAQSLRSPEETEQFRLQWLGRKQGRLKLISDAWLKSAPAEAKKLIGQRFNTLKSANRERLDQAETTIPAAASSTPGHRHHPPRHPPRPRRRAPAHPHLERDRLHLPAPRLLRRRRPRGRNRLLQLRIPQLPPQPPRARHPGHPRHRRPGAQAPPRPPAHAHPHLARPDPHHGAAAAAHPHRHPRQGAPQRRRRRHPLAHLPPGRRPLRRHQHHLLRPQRHARPRHEGPLRLQRQNALLPVLLPLHRTQRRRPDLLHLLRRQGLPQVQALRLDRAPRLRHGRPRRLRQSRSATNSPPTTRRRSPASPSAWASTASP